MTRRSTTILGSAVAFLALSILANCRTTQTPREQFSDQAITAKVKTRLTTDRFSNLVNISVDVTNGVVTLAGEVPTEEVRRDAEAETWKVEGVRRVHNNLQVSRRR
jgi:hyperosmotically inducible periplasmic protein